MNLEKLNLMLSKDRSHADSKKKTIHVGYFVKSLIYSSINQIFFSFNYDSKECLYYYHRGIFPYSEKDGYSNEAVIFETTNGFRADMAMLVKDIPVYTHPQELISNSLEFLVGNNKIRLFNYGREVMLSYYDDMIIHRCLKLQEIEKLKKAIDLDSNERNMEKIKSEIRTCVDSVDLSKILNGLQINVTEFFCHKVGDNDTYIVEKNTTVNKPIAEIDHYLQKYLQLGKVEVYRDSGYCTAESMRLNDIIIGDYSNEQIELEMQQFVNKYNKEEHYQFLIKEYMDSIKLKQWKLNSLRESLIDFTVNPIFHLFRLILGKRSFRESLDFFDKTHKIKAKSSEGLTDEDFVTLNKDLSQFSQYVLAGEFKMK